MTIAIEDRVAVKETTRTVRNFQALSSLFDAIESGETPKPDWIDLAGDARLTSLDDEQLRGVLARIHACTLRGFKANNVKKRGKQEFLRYWQSITRSGFHDFAEDCWMKCYDSPHVENYDYVQAYLDRGLDALDPYMVYSSVLGTWEYSVEDFVNTELCRDVQTVVEPLAGSAEFCHTGHFRYPDMSFFMFDLDEEAKKHVEEKFWHPQTRREYLIGDALAEETWKQVKAFSHGKSLSYIGKQSHNFFDTKELVQLLDWGTRYTDYFMLEVSEPYLVEDEPTRDDLTRREMKAAGFRVALDDVDDLVPNPLTNRLDFSLIAWNKAGDKRTLFDYLGWIGWQAPTLTALGRFLGLECMYFHSEDTEFLPVTEGTETSDCRENNTFLLFRRPADA